MWKISVNYNYTAHSGAEGGQADDGPRQHFTGGGKTKESVRKLAFACCHQLSLIIKSACDEIIVFASIMASGEGKRVAAATRTFAIGDTSPSLYFISHKQKIYKPLCCR